MGWGGGGGGGGVTGYILLLLHTFLYISIYIFVYSYIFLYTFLFIFIHFYIFMYAFSYICNYIFINFDVHFYIFLNMFNQTLRQLCWLPLCYSFFDVILYLIFQVGEVSIEGNENDEFLPSHPPLTSDTLSSIDKINEPSHCVRINVTTMLILSVSLRTI